VILKKLNRKKLISCSKGNLTVQPYIIIVDSNLNNIHAFYVVTFRSQSFNFFILGKKEFRIGRVWKDVSDISFAGQRAKT